MDFNENEVRQRIKNIILEETEYTGIYNDGIKIHQLGLNSVDYISLLIKFEEAFLFEFDDETLQSEFFDNICDIVAHILKKLSMR